MSSPFEGRLTSSRGGSGNVQAAHPIDSYGEPLAQHYSNQSAGAQAAATPSLYADNTAQQGCYIGGSSGGAQVTCPASLLTSALKVGRLAILGTESWTSCYPLMDSDWKEHSLIVCSTRLLGHEALITLSCIVCAGAAGAVACSQQ